MFRYRRLKIEGGAYFFTLALADRGGDLLVRHIERLRHTFPASHHSLTHLLPLCAAWKSSATLLFDRQTSSANGAWGRQDRHDSAGMRRRHGRAGVPVERTEIDVAGGAAGRTACPQEPIAGRDGGTDCRRKQHRHPLRLALVPHRDQVLGILKDLLVGRTARSRFLLRRLAASILHFAAVESHGEIVVE